MFFAGAQGVGAVPSVGPRRAHAGQRWHGRQHLALAGRLGKASWHLQRSTPVALPNIPLTGLLIVNINFTAEGGKPFIACICCFREDSGGSLKGQGQLHSTLCNGMEAVQAMMHALMSRSILPS